MGGGVGRSRHQQEEHEAGENRRKEFTAQVVGVLASEDLTLP